MDSVVQFQDLTEVKGVANDGPGYDLVSRTYIKPSFSGKHCDTEFAFGVQSTSQPDNVLVKAGFTPVSTVNNWYTGHWGDIRPQTIWWKKMEGKKNDKTPNRTGFGSYTKRTKEDIIALEAALQNHPSGYFIEFIASGCGAALYDNPEIRPYNIWKFCGLIRLPLEITSEYEAWLKKNYYRFLDKGTMAQYWVNGWNPAEWSFEKEIERWGGWGAQTAPYKILHSSPYGYAPRYEYTRPDSWVAHMKGPDGVEEYKAAARKELPATYDNSYTQVTRRVILDAWNAQQKGK